ncbi:MAG: hypothetical protein U1F61_06550 [Opitutaceae bacterium]
MKANTPKTRRWWHIAQFVIAAVACQLTDVYCSASPQPPLPASFRGYVSPKNIAWIKRATQVQLYGSRIPGKDGVWLHTPDGAGFYNALWTRDYQYMVEFAGDLMDPQEIKASILYILRGQRADGCIPDRVTADGVPVYGPGPQNDPNADHALDNNPFFAKLVCSYLDLTGDLDFFRQIEPGVRKAMDHTSRAANGLVYNPPEDPVGQYGFTDATRKTGHLLFCSLLYYDACRRMEQWCRKVKCGDPDGYRQRAEQIKQSVDLLWNEDAGMYWAASDDCRQVDIWGSALAVYVGITSAEKADRIAEYLVKNYDGIVLRGQVRHLPAGEFWQRFTPRLGPKGWPPGTYQNGAFWGTPTAWVAPVIARKNHELAVRMITDAIVDYRTNGIMECINEGYHKLPNYVTSATNVYGLVR